MKWASVALVLGLASLSVIVLAIVTGWCHEHSWYHAHWLFQHVHSTWTECHP